MTANRVLSALVLAVLVVLSGHAAPVGGVALESGIKYYITLSKHPECNEVQYLGFTDKACSSHNTVTLGPGAGMHKRWELDVKETMSDGSYVVQIFDFWDPTDLPVPKCLGKLSVAKPRLCKNGPSVSKVELQSSGAQRWILRPAGSNTFQIISSARRAGCMRYLGAAGRCGALRPALFKGDAGTGLQRWVIKEVPHQQSIQPAGEPIVTSSTTTASAWDVKWTDGEAGVPVESYALKCTAATATSCFDPPVGPIIDNIPRGTGAGTVEGLPADTHLHCFVIALNEHGAVCSAAQPIRTAPLPPSAVGPGAPTVTDSALASGVWKVKWTDGTAGDPEETYSALCVSFGDTCHAVATGNSVYGIKRGVQSADVTGLPTGKYSCFVRAENVLDTACSAAQTVDVPRNPANTPPGKPTALFDAVSGDMWLVSWQDGAKGTPEETYSAYCGHRGAGCTDRPQGFPETSIARGVQRGHVVGLPLHTPLDCFVVAENIEGRVCSDPMAVEIGRYPPPPPVNVDRPAGQPWAVSTLAVTATSWTALWYDGAVGVPQETYTLVCTQPWAGCHGPPVGITSNIARGVDSGTVLGLSPSSTYHCHVIAENRAGSVCSEPITVNTPPYSPVLVEPGKPQALHTVDTGPNTWTATWVDGTRGVPEEVYDLLCYRPGTPCISDPHVSRRRLQQISVPRYVSATHNIRRGTQIGTVLGLNSGEAYTCYVKSINAVGAKCSDPVTVMTPGAPRRPEPASQLRTLGVTATSWTVTWEEGMSGIPVETYNLLCVLPGAGCRAQPVGLTWGIPRGVRTGTVNGLAPSTTYDCYVDAYNLYWYTCSDGISVTTAGPATTKAGQPTGVTGTLQVNTWAANWIDGTIGNPVETYTVKCVSLNAGCAAAPVAQTAGIARGTQAGAAGPLPSGASYSCYIIAINTVSAVCSAPQTVTVGTLSVTPGKPTGVTLDSRTAYAVTLSWTDGTPGVPEEQYSVKCVEFPGLCGEPPLGIVTRYIQRGTGTGKTTSVPSSSHLNCYVIAYNPDNPNDNVCSDAVDVPALV